VTGRGGPVTVGRVRAFTSLPAALAAVLALAACGRSSAAARPPRGTPAILAGHVQRATVKLPAGRSSTSFQITATARDELQLSVSAPADADLAVEAVKQDGERLRLLESTRERPACGVAGGRSRCRLRFAVGANLIPGRWTILVSKTAGRPAGATVAMTFTAPTSR